MDRPVVAYGADISSLLYIMSMCVIILKYKEVTMKITIRESDNPRKASISISLMKTHKGISEFYHGELRNKLSSSINLIKRNGVTGESFMITVASAFEDEYSGIPKTNIAQSDLSRPQLIEMREQIDYILNYK